MRNFLLAFASLIIVAGAILIFHLLPRQATAQVPTDTSASASTAIQSSSSDLATTPAATTALTLADCAPASHPGILDRHVINMSDHSSPTVQGALEQLQAQCTETGYVRPDGQRIQLYDLDGCYGWSADKVKSFTDAQQPIVQKLEQQDKYWVLEVGCNPNTLP